jgi:hypothetical protein
MKCVSPASYFKKGYRCPVCQQETSLDIETVKYGSLPSSLTLHNSILQQVTQVSTAGTPLTKPGSSDGARKHTPHPFANIANKQSALERVGGVGGSHALGGGHTHAHTHSTTTTTTNSNPNQIDYQKMEIEMSARLTAREEALEARYVRNSKGSPLADLSQV